MVYGVNGYHSSVMLNILSQKSRQLQDLSVQLGTGRKAQSYGGLGPDVGRSVDLRAQISDLNGFRSTIQQTKLQLKIMDNALSRIVSIGSQVSGSATATEYNINANGKSVSQMTAATLVDEVLGLLDTQVDGDYVFSGTSTDKPPTRNYDQIVHGFNGQDGLITVTDERIRADKGTDGLGRLTLSRAGSVATITEQATDFGYKLDAVSSNLSNATVTGPTGTPKAISVNLSAKPKENEEISFTFKLPDGTTDTIKLRAANGITQPGDGKFSLNGSPADVAQAIQDELGAMLKKSVVTKGEAGSRIKASLDFFQTGGGGEPKRVIGNPPETATSLGTATAAGKPTVNWYVGENGTGSARNTAKSLVDEGFSVAHGARANESGIARQLAYMTAFTLPTYKPDDTTDKARHAAFANAISGGLSTGQQGDVVATIQRELAVVSGVIGKVDQRHKATESVIKTASDKVDGIDKEEVAAKILTLKNNIEASYKATSMMYQLSLTKFI